MKKPEQLRESCRDRGGLTRRDDRQRGASSQGKRPKESTLRKNPVEEEICRLLADIKNLKNNTYLDISQVERRQKRKGRGGKEHRHEVAETSSTALC